MLLSVIYYVCGVFFSEVTARLKFSSWVIPCLEFITLIVLTNKSLCYYTCSNELYCPLNPLGVLYLPSLRRLIRTSIYCAGRKAAYYIITIIALTQMNIRSGGEFSLYHPLVYNYCIRQWYTGSI